MEVLSGLIKQTLLNNSDYKPLQFRLSNEDDKIRFHQLLARNEIAFVHDEIQSQLKELAKCNRPSQNLTPQELESIALSHIGDSNINEYGVWVYYPWSKTLVHLLDKDEFVTVRTNRNKNKITTGEQQELNTKTIAIIGLSVGHSIALTIATERICGALRLADFDELELSNLNRIRSGVKNIAVPKVVIAAREIAELDPYLDVEIYAAGTTRENLQDFLSKRTKADILVEVCDGLDMKIEARIKAKQLGIPVVMDTNDRGMLDIERFDLQPDRPILHGFIDDVDFTNLKQQTPQERMQLIMKIISVETISQRLKDSIPALNKTINALPQLASSVMLGGAVTTDVCRRILLNQLNCSGRFFVDFEQLVSDL